MEMKIKELVNWLNEMDNGLISRIGGEPFIYRGNYNSFEIKNNLGRILIKPEEGFAVLFNDGRVFFSTLLPRVDWLPIVKKEIEQNKISILLSTLPSSQKNEPFPFSWLINFLSYGKIIKPLGWELLTKEEVLTIVLPYITKVKQEIRDGHYRNYPIHQRLKEIETYLNQVRSCPEIAQLVSLLE